MALFPVRLRVSHKTLPRHNKANASWHSASAPPLFEGTIAQGLMNENSQYQYQVAKGHFLGSGRWSLLHGRNHTNIVLSYQNAPRIRSCKVPNHSFGPMACPPLFLFAAISCAHAGISFTSPLSLWKETWLSKLSLILHAETQDLPLTDDELLPPESTNLLQSSKHTLFFA